MTEKKPEPRNSWSDTFRPDEVESEEAPTPFTMPEKKDKESVNAQVTEMVLRRELHLAKARILELELEKLGVKSS